LVSPFIAAYVLHKMPELTRLLACKDCGFRFFETRYDADEVAGLYLGYRGPNYFRSRHRCEFWYSKKTNDAIGSDSREIATRRAGVMAYLTKHVDASKIEKILDYGGDRGQFIPEQIGKERYVYEISKAQPVQGVTNLSERSQVAGRSYDLIMLCHVLEHCSDPIEVLNDIKALTRNGKERPLFYCEVPLEVYDLRWVGTSRFYETYLAMLSAVKPLLYAIDFYSTTARVKFGVIPPLGFLKQHEHINFFSVASLTALMNRAGFQVLGCDIVTNKRAVFPSVVKCLATTCAPL